MYYVVIDYLNLDSWFKSNLPHFPWQGIRTSLHRYFDLACYWESNESYSIAENRIYSYHHQDVVCMLQSSYPYPRYEQPHLHLQARKLVLFLVQMLIWWLKWLSHQKCPDYLHLYGYMQNSKKINKLNITIILN